MRQKALKNEAGRSETLSVRLDPKLRYLMELSARRLFRSLSGYMEWAVAESLTKVEVHPDGETIADLAEFLWDVNEVHRFLKLAFNFPDLLDHQEQILWKSIRTNKLLWRGHKSKDGEFIFFPTVDALILERAEEAWNDLRAIARGEKPSSVLPKWEEIQRRGLKARNSHLIFDFKEEATPGSAPADDETSPVKEAK